MYGVKPQLESAQELTVMYRKPNPLLIPIASKINPLPDFII